MEKVYIIGASGFAAEVTEYLKEDRGYQILGYFDLQDDDYKKYKFEAPFLHSERDFNFKSNDSVMISIADPKIKNKLYTELKLKNVNFPTFISNHAYISANCSIGEGSIICPFVTVTSNAKIGSNFHANIYSYVSHDCIIGNNVTFAPSVKCNGNVIIEDNVYIGTGAIIFQGTPEKPLIIGKNSIVAAGSVVTKSVPDNMTVFGSPAIEFTKENLKRRY